MDCQIFVRPLLILLGVGLDEADTLDDVLIGGFGFGWRWSSGSPSRGEHPHVYDRATRSCANPSRAWQTT